MGLDCLMRQQVIIKLLILGLNVDVKEIVKYVDSVSFCLSKGLCCPIGAIIAGNTNFIKKAKKFRKMLGGGLRQVGMICAPGIYAL